MPNEPEVGTPDVVLRAVEPDDILVFFEQHLDPESVRMAAVEPRSDRQAFVEHWTKVLAVDDNIAWTAVVDGQVAGHVVCWPQDGAHMVGYWFGREFWGRGIATKALAAFLADDATRPLTAHVATHNVGSKRVLEKCGFEVVGRTFAEDGVEEFTLILRR